MKIDREKLVEAMAEGIAKNCEAPFSKDPDLWTNTASAALDALIDVLIDLLPYQTDMSVAKCLEL